MTLRARFATILGASVAGSMMLVALVASVTLNDALRAGLDTHLSTAAHAIAVLVDVEHGSPRLDGEDKRQAQILLGPDMQGAIFDASGREVSALHASPAPPQVSAPRESDDGAIESAPDASGVRVATAPIIYRGKRFGFAAVWGESEYIDQFLRNALVTTAAVAVIAGLLAIGLSWLVAGRAFASLRHMADVAEEIEAHDLSQRLDAHGNDEVARVARAFNRMLQRLQGAFDRQREFTAAASHELRAPLAVIRAEAEVTLERERDATAYQQSLTTISEEVQRADSVIGALLAAARSENTAPQRQDVRAGELAETIVARFTPLCRSRGLAIQASGDLDARCSIDVAAVDSALNAIVHNATGVATSSVALRVERTPASIAFSVQDDGPGFSDEALQRGRERFWRGSDARPNAGSGLGLAMADAVARAHGGQLRLVNSREAGALVTLEFPAFM